MTMSAFSGRYEKGAMKARRKTKREQAEARQAAPMVDGCRVDPKRHSNERCLRQHWDANVHSTVKED